MRMMKAIAIASSSTDNNKPLKADAKNELSTADLLVFTGLESLGSLAVLGNLCLIIVLLRFKYLSRASFILMLNLAIADVLHGLVTTFYFYPPIALKRHHLSIFVMRIFNVVDWTAWAITLTHMSAICLDRLTAITLYGRYSMTVTVNRIRVFSVSCWVVFTMTNTAFFFFNACCMILPLKDHDYYSFGYHHSDTKFRGSGILNYTNVYVYTYTPVEILTIIVLSVSNPITLMQLYRRRKRKQALRQQQSDNKAKNGIPSVMKARSQWQRASAMLIAMSMRMGNRNLNSNVREPAFRRANRQQQRIMMQISIVAIIFFSYMSAYYLSYYVFAISSKWAMAFHSFFYSTTHMINPVIYFTCNTEMRSQLKDSIRTFWLHSTCRSKKHTGESACSCSKSMPTDKPSNRFNSVIATETSPLFSSNCHYKSIAIRHLSNQRDETISSSLANLVETISPAQSDPALTTRKASGIHFDEKSNKVTVNILDNEGSYFEEAFGEAIQKQPSFEKINGSGCNGVLRSNNIRRKSSLSHALQQTAKQRTTLIDRLIASLIADEDNDISEQSSSDEDILLSFSSSSSSPIRAKPRTQSCSLGFTSTWEPTDYNQMRISSTMDALPSTLRSVSRKAFRMSDRTLNYNSDDDDVPLLRVSLTDDDSDTNPMPEPYECASTVEDLPVTSDLPEDTPAEKICNSSASDEDVKNVKSKRRYEEMCCSVSSNHRSSPTFKQPLKGLTLSEESLNDDVFL